MILADCIKHGPQREYKPGRWAAAKPIPGPFLRRFRDAFSVLTGRAEAVFFAEADPDLADLMLSRPPAGSSVEIEYRILGA